MTSTESGEDFDHITEEDLNQKFKEVIRMGEATVGSDEQGEIVKHVETEEVIGGKTIRRVVTVRKVTVPDDDHDQVHHTYDRPYSQSGDFSTSEIVTYNYSQETAPTENEHGPARYQQLNGHDVGENPYQNVQRSAGSYENVPHAPLEERDSLYSSINKELKTRNRTSVVEGDGIKEGTVGQPILFTLDGRRAGPGQLSCRCRAPSGTMTYVYITDNKDGTYTVDLNATEPGLHTVEVEWDGQPIPGSPFLVRIMQAPDVKKVRAHGPGLESGLMNSFQGMFKVETKGAGPGTLKIRIHGPKGAFKVEMSRDHPKDRTINVKYNPTESGIYTANVFWSDEHVPGSPFEIFVAQDEENLKKWEQNREQVHRSEGLINGH